MRVVLLLLLLSVSACGSMPAECRLERVAELPIGILGTVPVVPAKINGQDVSLILDTGSNATMLTRTAARRLGIEQAEGMQTVLSAGGPLSLPAVPIRQLSLGGVVSTPPRALVTSGLNLPVDGLLGFDALMGFELDLDMPASRAVLYRARPCPSAQPGWSGRSTGLPKQQQPGTGHLFVPVELDGQPLRAMLDTGASRSVVSLQVAGEAGLRGARLRALPGLRAQGPGEGGVPARIARFRSLRVGDDVLTDPVIAITDLPVAAGDMIVGTDYLGTRRIWFSFLLGRVWVQDGGGPLGGGAAR